MSANTKLNWSEMSAKPWCEMTEAERLSVPKWVRVPNICKQCGKRFTASRANLLRGSYKYCSRACAQEGSVRTPIQHFDGVRFTLKKGRQYYENTTHGFMHRYVWAYFNGAIPPGHVVHHINENTHDNRIENLQVMTYAEHNTLHNTGRIVSKRSVAERLERLSRRVEFHRGRMERAVDQLESLKGRLK